MIAYHGTKRLSRVLRDGLRVAACTSTACKHICLAEAPEVAAAFALGPDGGIVRVDLTGLDVPDFVGGEARSHVDIPPARITPFTEEVIASLAGHVDPFYGYPPVNNHPHCWPHLPTGREALGLAP